jgi:hypothetical protein
MVQSPGTPTPPPSFISTELLAGEAKNNSVWCSHLLCIKTTHGQDQMPIHKRIIGALTITVNRDVVGYIQLTLTNVSFCCGLVDNRPPSKMSSNWSQSTVGMPVHSNMVFSVKHIYTRVGVQIILFRAQKWIFFHQIYTHL